jgi:hypothetical protein
VSDAAADTVIDPVSEALVVEVVPELLGEFPQAAAVRPMTTRAEP